MIRPKQDAHPGNNEANRWIEITGGPRVLMASKYVDDPLAGSLRDQGFAVEVVSDPAALRVGQLAGARAVILNNVPAFEVPAEFQEALNFYVREQGGGLLMVGGKQSFGSGGYFQSALDPLLPISMELKNDHRKLAVSLAIVMDRSGSMAAGVAGGKTKMDLANNGAAAAIELLGMQDEVCVLAVDSEAEMVLPLTRIGNQQQQLMAKVRRIRSQGGGIFVYVGMEQAWKELKKSPLGTKHIILFSDAADSEEPGKYRELLDEMNAAGATVSVIGLGTKADPDAALLEDIAKRGNGRIFFTQEAMEIPRIFAQETVTVARSAFVEEATPAKPTGKWTEVSPEPFEWPGAVDG